jgi:hypothetical protein
MLSEPSRLLAFLFIFERNTILKSYLFYLPISLILACGCAENKSKESKKEQSSDRSKDDVISDFTASGIENLNASDKMKDIICQTWNYKEDVADAADADPSSNIEVVYRGYSLFSDGTMVKDPRGNMVTGTWVMNDKMKPITIDFILSNRKTETYQLAYLMPYEMKLARGTGKDKLIVDLSSDAIRHVNLSDDPFYITNNAWRFKPLKAESDDQIRQRLKSCIHFFILFYDEKIHGHADAVSFTGLPSCFKWYGGGIFLQKENELQSKWINSFYNKEEAMKAYKLADKLMSIKYEWPKKESNWLKLNVAVLRQMEKKIDSL